MNDNIKMKQELTKHETNIKTIFKQLNHIDKKIDEINNNIQFLTTELNHYTNEINNDITKVILKSNEKTFQLDKRVTALETHNRTLRWVLTTILSSIILLQFIIDYLRF